MKQVAASPKSKPGGRKAAAAATAKMAATAKPAPQLCKGAPGGCPSGEDDVEPQLDQAGLLRPGPEGGSEQPQRAAAGARGQAKARPRSKPVSTTAGLHVERGEDEVVDTTARQAKTAVGARKLGIGRRQKQQQQQAELLPVPQEEKEEGQHTAPHKRTQARPHPAPPSHQLDDASPPKRACQGSGPCAAAEGGAGQEALPLLARLQSLRAAQAAAAAVPAGSAAAQRLVTSGPAGPQLMRAEACDSPRAGGEPQASRGSRGYCEGAGEGGEQAPMSPGSGAKSGVCVGGQWGSPGGGTPLTKSLAALRVRGSGGSSGVDDSGGSGSAAVGATCGNSGGHVDLSRMDLSQEQAGERRLPQADSDFPEPRAGCSHGPLNEEPCAGGTPRMSCCPLDVGVFGGPCLWRQAPGSEGSVIVLDSEGEESPRPRCAGGACALAACPAPVHVLVSCTAPVGLAVAAGPVPGVSACLLAGACSAHSTPAMPRTGLSESSTPALSPAPFPSPPPPAQQDEVDVVDLSQTPAVAGTSLPRHNLATAVAALAMGQPHHPQLLPPTYLPQPASTHQGCRAPHAALRRSADMTTHTTADAATAATTSLHQAGMGAEAGGASVCAPPQLPSSCSSVLYVGKRTRSSSGPATLHAAAEASSPHARDSHARQHGSTLDDSSGGPRSASAGTHAQPSAASTLDVPGRGGSDCLTTDHMSGVGKLSSGVAAAAAASAAAEERLGSGTNSHGSGALVLPYTQRLFAGHDWQGRSPEAVAAVAGKAAGLEPRALPRCTSAPPSPSPSPSPWPLRRRRRLAVGAGYGGGLKWDQGLGGEGQAEGQQEQEACPGGGPGREEAQHDFIVID